MELERRKAICIYHDHCTDGFGAAWVVRKYFAETMRYYDLEFVAASYGDEPPDVTGALVVIVDFSYPKDVLIAMGVAADNILVLDHHKTAEEALSGFPSPSRDIRSYNKKRGNVQCLFDMAHSGARMAWDFFFPTEICPMSIAIIEDRDLWKFNIPKTENVMSAIFSYEYDFDIWDEIMEGDIYPLFTEGAALRRGHMKNIKEHIAQNMTEVLLVVEGGSSPTKRHLIVPCLNAPGIWASDAGHIMASNHPSKMAIVWTMDGDVIKVSLRSVEGGPDVSQIAKMYGGGGHEHAAGYRIGDIDIPW